MLDDILVAHTISAEEPQKKDAVLTLESLHTIAWDVWGTAGNDETGKQSNEQKKHKTVSAVLTRDHIKAHLTHHLNKLHLVYILTELISEHIYDCKSFMSLCKKTWSWSTSLTRSWEVDSLLFPVSCSWSCTHLATAQLTTHQVLMLFIPGQRQRGYILGGRDEPPETRRWQQIFHWGGREWGLTWCFTLRRASN